MLKIMIKNELEKDKTLATKLAQEAGFKNATPLYKFLNEPEREMDSLISLIKIVEYLFEGKTEQILNDYFYGISPNGKFARQALEYSSFCNLKGKNELIIKMEECSNAESREWASMYKLSSRIHENTTVHLKHLNALKIKSSEMNAFKSIMLLYCYYYLGNIHMVDAISNVLDVEIDVIKNNEFIKNNYYTRLYKANSVLYHHKNRISESRECADKVIALETNSYVLASAYQIKGMTYLYEDFEIGDKLLKKSYELYQKTPDKYDGQIRSSLNLNSCFWNEQMFDLRENGEIFDKHDAIFHYVKNGNIQKAENILASINQEEITDVDMPFHHYAKGIIYSEDKYLYKSIEHFKTMGDQFYINLPILELRKKGENGKLLDLLLI